MPTYKVPRGDKGRGFLPHRPPGPTAIDPETGKMYDDLLVIVTPTEARAARAPKSLVRRHLGDG